MASIGMIEAQWTIDQLRKDLADVMREQNERAKGTSDALLDDSLRVHAREVVEYILRGNGRRIVPKAIYFAAWEIQYALNRASSAPIYDKAPDRGGKDAT